MLPDREIRDLMTFLEAHLGKDIMSGKVAPTAQSDVAEKFGKVEYKGSIVVENFDRTNIKSLLMFIADMGGVDQGKPADGVLRGMNSKRYGGWLGRIFTSGEWAQNQVVSELQAYNLLNKNITSVDQLKELMKSNITSVRADDIDKAFTDKDPTKLKELLRLLANVSMSKISQVRDTTAMVTTRDQHANEVVKLAEANMKHIQKVQNAVASSPQFTALLETARAKIMGENPDVTADSVQTLLSTWKTTFFSNPELYVGPTFHQDIDTHTHKVLDYAGKVLSETKTTHKSTATGIALVLSITLAGVSARTSETTSISASAGVTGTAGIEGVALILGAQARGTKTLSPDANRPLEPLK